MQRTWDWLAEQPEDAAELAQLLFEATPRLGVAAARSPRKAPRSRRHPADPNASLLDRLKAAEPMPSGRKELDLPYSVLLAIPLKLCRLLGNTDYRQETFRD